MRTWGPVRASLCICRTWLDNRRNGRLSRNPFSNRRKSARSLLCLALPLAYSRSQSVTVGAFRIWIYAGWSWFRGWGFEWRGVGLGVFGKMDSLKPLISLRTCQCGYVLNVYGHVPQILGSNGTPSPCSNEDGWLQTDLSIYSRISFGIPSTNTTTASYKHSSCER